MRLIISGREYDASKMPCIGDLRELKPAFGFGFGTVLTQLNRVAAKDVSMLELIDDEVFLDALIAMMWLQRRREGEQDLTVDEVRRTPIDEVRFAGDKQPEKVAPDPTPAADPKDSGPAASAAGPASRKRRPSSKTSTKRSATASS